MSPILRIAEPADATGILAIYAPYCDASVVSFETAAPTVEEMSKRIESVLRDYPWLVCEIDGQIVGYVYASRHRERAAYRWTVEVTVYVATAHHRRGIGRALYSSLFSILAEQNYIKAFAGITLPNPASVGLHESLGFSPIGVYPSVGYKLGRWLDVGWWQRGLCLPTTPPSEPCAFSHFRSSELVPEALCKGALLLSNVADSNISIPSA
jgi:phosphinothricin acetyltransferase